MVVYVEGNDFLRSTMDVICLGQPIFFKLTKVCKKHLADAQIKRQASLSPLCLINWLSVHKNNNRTTQKQATNLTCLKFRLKQLPGYS